MRHRSRLTLVLLAAVACGSDASTAPPSTEAASFAATPQVDLPLVNLATFGADKATCSGKNRLAPGVSFLIVTDPDGRRHGRMELSGVGPRVSSCNTVNVSFPAVCLLAVEGSRAQCSADMPIDLFVDSDSFLLTTPANGFERAKTTVAFDGQVYADSVAGMLTFEVHGTGTIGNKAGDSFAVRTDIGPASVRVVAR